MATTDPQTVLILFDVDGTLTVPRKVADPSVLVMLADLKKAGYTIGFVGGSDLPKQLEQIGSNALEVFHYCFSQNGLDSYQNGESFHRASLVSHLGDTNLRRVIDWTLRYIADLDIPKKRGTFIELRNGLINISPIGRNCSDAERDEFEKYDLEHKVREKMVAAAKAAWADELKLKCSIGGQISFDVFPYGWDKTYCLQFVEGKFDEIHFFGDKTAEGGNDFEIYHDARTVGHAVQTYEDTLRIVGERFLKK